MTIPAQLAARGKPITLADGRTVHLRYGFKALFFIEEKFGGLAHLQRQMQGGPEGPVITATFDLIAAGLLDEHDGTGQPLTRERLADLVTHETLSEYGKVAGEALQEAFPTPAPAEPGPVETEPSPGDSGTTSPPSPSDGPTSSSGA